MTPEKIEEALRRLREAKEVCYDAETSGLDWRNDHICGHVLSFGPRPDDSYYLPVRHASGGNISGCNVPAERGNWDGGIHPIEHEIVKELDRQDITVIGHNLAFDLKFLYRIGLTKFDAKFDDTIINAVLCNEWHESVSLDHLTKVYRVEHKKVSILEHIAQMVPEARGNVAKSNMQWFYKLRGDDREAIAYAAGDGTSTWQLRHVLRSEMEKQNLSLVHGVECRVIPVLARMVTRGVKIDEEQIHRVKQEIARRKEVARSKLPADFNPRSSSQVRKLMEDNNFTDWPLTPKGSPSFPESWLETNPIGQDIVAIRKLENLENSFINPMLETHLWRGRVHPEYNQLRGDEYGTVTGRLSSSNPNLQQVSKRNKELGWLHRSIFVPDDGMLWGSADYEQMEPKLLAYYTRCKVLMDGFNANPPVDAHMAVTRACNPDWQTLTPEELKMRRETGKRINQTLITGGGKGVLVSKYGVDPNEVDGVWNEYFKAMPEIKTFQRTAAQRMASRGYVISLLGRHARMNGKDYVALNRLLQCGNADCLKLKMVEIDDYFRSEGDRVNLLNNVHDSFDFQFRPEDRKIYDEALKIMTSFGPDDVIQLDVPITADHKIGNNWAEATWGP